MAKQWTMPKWMEPYRGLIRNTGGNSIEELYNDHTTTVFENAPRAILCVAVKSQVDFLRLLHERGMLAEIIKPAPAVRRTPSG